jgi:UV DNA damage repair endonuclease
MKRAIVLIFFFLLISFLLIIQLKIYYITKLHSRRKNAKYEGLFLESLKFDQMKNFAFVYFPHIITSIPEDDEQSLQYISKHNFLNTLHIITYLIIFIFLIIGSIFFPNKDTSIE